MLKRIALYITLLSSIAGNAQYLSVRGDFEVDQIRGCHDLLLTVNNINPGTDVILYQYEGRSSQETDSISHTYVSTGTYWLLQYIQGPTGEKVDSILIEILDPVIPDIDLKTCNANGVQVEINNLDYELYEINYGDGTTVQVPVGTNPSPYTYAVSNPVNVSVTGLYNNAKNNCGVNTIAYTPVNQVLPATISQLTYLDDKTTEIQYNLPPSTINTLEISINSTSNYSFYKNINPGSVLDTIRNLFLDIRTYCFRIASHDACSNFIAYSNELCTVYAGAEAVNDSINLTWSTLFPTGYSGIDINRDDTVIENLTGQLLSYSDTSVVCKINYCYTIDAIHTDGSVSRSNQVCDLAFSTTAPSSVNNISAQINDDNTINWYWLPPVGEDVKYYKIYSSSSVLSDSTSVTNISSEWNNDASNCLQIDLINNCDVPSGLIDPVCPLEVSRYFNSDGSVTLSWEDYLGWNNGVNGYALVIYDQNLIQQDSLLLGSELQYTDPLPDGNEQVSYFRVWAIPEDASLVPSGSNIIEIIRPPVIAIPNSFTPNGDNINDVFAITGKYIESVELSIFNRWGALIYHVNGSSWDGMIGGKKVPLGTYIYNVVVKDFAGYEHIRNGTVLILKD